MHAGYVTLLAEHAIRELNDLFVREELQPVTTIAICGWLVLRRMPTQ